MPRIPLTAAALATAAFAGTASAAPVVVSKAITEAEVTAAQQAWCGALEEIGATYDRDGQEAAAALAGNVIDAAYGYQMGVVLFKPTLPSRRRPSARRAKGRWPISSAAIRNSRTTRALR
jgi:hypothetical protein